MPYGYVQELLRRLESLISQCAAVDEKYVRVLADFVLSTWFVDRLEVAPYLSVVGLPQSGKTTLLRALSLVCRRPLLIADITSASFYQACTRFVPTILIDETGSIRSNRTLRHMLRSGTTRDVLAVRKNRTFHCYGAKVISWLEPPNDTGQCIPAEPLDPAQNAVLRALFSLIHLEEGISSVRVGNLTCIVNLFLDRAGENLRLLPRKVGAVLTSLGVGTRTRTNSGWALSVNLQDAEKLHQLAACYGIDGFKDRFLGMSPEDCSLCRAAGLRKKGPDLPPAPHDYQVRTKRVNLREKLNR
jgi:hypothetical protein